MAISVNKVTLVGRLGQDPDIKTSADGSKFASFSLATSESWKDKGSGEYKEKTEWHKIVVFNSNLAEIVERLLKKGSKVYVEGQLQTRKWTDHTSSQDKFVTEVVLGRFRGELVALDAKERGSTMDHQDHEIDDEIPF